MRITLSKPFPSGWTKDSETNLPETRVPEPVELPRQPWAVYTGTVRRKRNSYLNEAVLGLCVNSQIYILSNILSKPLNCFILLFF